VQALSSTLIPFRLSTRSGFTLERDSEPRIAPVVSHPSKYRRPGSAKEPITSEPVTASYLPTTGARSSLQSNASSSCSSLPTTQYHDARQTFTSSDTSMDVAVPAKHSPPLPSPSTPPSALLQSTDYSYTRSLHSQPMSPISAHTFGLHEDAGDHADDAATSSMSKRHGGGLRKVLARIAPTRPRMPSLPDILVPGEGRSAPAASLRKIIRVSRKSPERPRFPDSPHEGSTSARDEQLRRPSLPSIRPGTAPALDTFVPLTPETFAPSQPPLRESRSVLSIRRWQRSLATHTGDVTAAQEYAELAQQHHHQQESSRRPSASLRPQWGDAGTSSSNPSPASSPSVTVVEHDEVVHIVRRGRCHATGYW
jgi:hypothetical protein